MRRTIALLLLSFTLWGQSPLPESEPSQGRRTGPFLLSISSDKRHYQAGETISITSVLLNETDQEFDLRQTSPMAFYGMDVILPGPAWLPFRYRSNLTEEGQRQTFRSWQVSFAPMRVKPGEKIVNHFELNKLYQMTAPGEYHVTFYFRAPSYVGQDGIVRSNELVIGIDGNAP